MRRLHTEAMCWLRFGKRLPIVCTEVGPWHADILGIGDKMVIEVEVKKTRSDLRADFRNKKTKHFTYANAEKYSGVFVPNYLYYYVPLALKDYALEVVSAEAPKAGLAVQMDTTYLDGRNTEVVKRPTRLHGEAPKPRFIRVAMQRMSSELCGRHLVYDDLIEKITTSLETTERSALNTLIRSVGTLDSEDLASDLEIRARELKQCVEGSDVFLSPEDRLKWINAAKKWLEAQYLNSREIQ